MSNKTLKQKLHNAIIDRDYWKGEAVKARNELYELRGDKVIVASPWEGSKDQADLHGKRIFK